MKNEAKLKLAKKHQENQENKQAIINEARAITAYTKQRKEELSQIKQSIESLAEALEVKVSFPDIDPLLQKLESLESLPNSFQDIKVLAENIIKNLSNEKEVKIAGFRELWEMIVRQNNKIDKASKEQAERTIEKFADLQTYIDQLTLTLQQGQQPEDYKPVRIVVGGDGTNLDFLKQFPSSRGGGGGSSSIDTSALATSAKQDTQITALQLIDDIVQAEDATHASGDKGVMALAQYNTTPAQSAGTVGDYSVLQNDASGRLYNRAIPDRPSAGSGRTHKSGAVANVTGSSIVGAAVTAGKTLYITSLTIVGFNNSAVTQGQFRVEDGSGGALKVPFNMPAVIASTIASTLAYAEPLQFTTSVFFTVTAGTASFGISWVGYEE